MRRSAFAYPDFRKLVAARFLFSFSVQLQAVVMGWLVFEIKRDPLYLGLIGLVEAVPALGLALYAGYVVDRSNPLRVYRSVLLVSFTSALLLLVMTLNSAGFSDSGRLTVIYSAAFLTGLARGFAAPSMYALMPQLVPREVLAVSSAWLTSAFQVAAISGPAVGGLLFAGGGGKLAFGVEVALLAASQVALVSIRFQPKIIPPDSKESFRESLLSGLKFVFSHQLLLSALALDMFAVLFGGATALLPIFASEILQVGPQGLGWLRAAPAVGALIMSVALIRRPVEHHGGRILLACVAGFGLCIIGFGLSTSFWLSMAFLALSGALDSVSMVIRGAIVSLCSPDHMRGRVASVNSIFIGSSNELGAFESGVAARLLGTVPSVVFGGAMTLLVVAVTAKLAPRLRALDLRKL
ncbi:MAG: MFS transporter [Bdellovibrionales bacterium]|nr:MFS transporter [Bdellovibrionales bacterium]